MDCSRLRDMASASPAASIDFEAPPAIVSDCDCAWLPRSQLGFASPRGWISEPPPRNLLLVKSSFLI
jgi:hypothetical protein